MLNTNYNNSYAARMNMLDNHEVAAFYREWIENISHLKKGNSQVLPQENHTSAS